MLENLKTSPQSETGVPKTKILRMLKNNKRLLDALHSNSKIQILKLITEGYSNTEIGKKLFISHRTVDTHRTNLMKKLEVNNIAGLIKYALKNIFID